MEDLNHLKNPIILKEKEFHVLLEVLNVLKPIKLAKVTISQKDANSIITDATLKFVLEQLSRLNSHKDMNNA